MWKRPLYINRDLKLVPMLQRHAEALFAIVESDRHYLGRWQNWPDHIRTEAHMREWIRLSQQKSASRQGFDLTIYFRGEIVGKIGLVYINWDMRHAEVGYWLAEASQGHGIMTRSCQAITAQALGSLLMRRVLVRCATENVRSRHIPERLGFMFDGVLPDKAWIRGRTIEEVRYSMSAERWNRNEIYHITTIDAWKAARQRGVYEASSLAEQGFIHLSSIQQVVRVANALYAGRTDLVLLCVDPARLQAQLKYEPPDLTVPAKHGRSELFPHLYGALNLDAVVRAVKFPPSDDGKFTLPSNLVSA